MSSQINMNTAVHTNWQDSMRNTVEKMRMIPILQQILVITAIYDAVMILAKHNFSNDSQFVAEWNHENAEKEVKEAENNVEKVKFKLKERDGLNNCINAVTKALEFEKGLTNFTKDSSKSDEMLKTIGEWESDIKKLNLTDTSLKDAEKKLTEYKNYETDKKAILDQTNKENEKAKAVFDYHRAHIFKALECSIPLWGSFAAYKWSCYQRPELLKTLSDRGE